MPVDLISLAVIALVAACCPIIARLIPGKLIPETVFLLVAGALLGPHMLGSIQTTESVGLLSDLGLAFLFLLAGYEINPKSLTGSQGKRGLLTWLISLTLAFLAVRLSPDFSANHIEGIAMAIALTTTALGTLMPILKERQLMSTRIGESTLAYGTWGELCPVLAMALLLSTRAEWVTVLILVAFVGIAVLVAVLPSKAKKVGHRLFEFLTANANTTSQTTMRMTVLLLIGLITLSAVFNLDIVLGAFAAGFVLRYIIPAGNEALEHKLEGMAYGFLIPVFFIVSGAKINLMAVFEQPFLLVGFIFMLLVIRAIPIFIALSTGKDTRDLSSHNRLTISLYCTTALPIIVAVTSVAVNADAMSQGTASVLVAAGAITVFLMPLLASITYRVADAQPIEAVREIRQNPRNIGSILRDHLTLERMMARQEAVERLAIKHRNRAASMLSRHLPGVDAELKTWLPEDAIKRAISIMNAADFDDDAWQEAKDAGDKAITEARISGDKRWERMKQEGVERWDALKQAGDEVAGLPWQERAAALQEKAERRRVLVEALDSAAQGIAARNSNILEDTTDKLMRASEAAKNARESIAATGLEAASDSAASQDLYGQPLADSKLLTKKERQALRREEHRKRLAERVEREQKRRLRELTRASNRHNK